MDVERTDPHLSLENACRLVPGVPVPEPTSAVEAVGTTTWASAAGLARSAGPAARILGSPSNGNPAAAVVAFAQGLSYAVAGPSAVGSFVAGVAMDVAPDRLTFGFGPGGFCERLSVDDLHVVRAVRGEYEDRVAEQVVAVLEPVFDQAHRVTRVGRRVIWSALSDSIATILLTAALAGAPERRRESIGIELRHAWAAANELIEAMGRRVPAMSSRPVAFPFTHDDGTAMWLVRGGCCFVYRGAPGAELCVTCPVLDDDKRRLRLRRWARESSLWRRKPSTSW